MSVASAEKAGKLLAQGLSKDQKVKLVKFLISLKNLYEFLSDISVQHTWERMDQTQMQDFQGKIDVLANQVVKDSIEIMDELNSENSRPTALEDLMRGILKNLNPLSAITRLGARSDCKNTLNAIDAVIAQLK